MSPKGPLSGITTTRPVRATDLALTAGVLRTQWRPERIAPLDVREHPAEAVVGQVHDRVVVLRLAEAVQGIVREVLRRVTADAGSERDEVAGDRSIRDRSPLSCTPPVEASRESE